MTLRINSVDWSGMTEDEIWTAAHALEWLNRTPALEAWMKAYGDDQDDRTGADPLWDFY